jgi:hypothetical protein
VQQQIYFLTCGHVLRALMATPCAAGHSQRQPDADDATVALAAGEQEERQTCSMADHDRLLSTHAAERQYGPGRRSHSLRVHVFDVGVDGLLIIQPRSDSAGVAERHIANFFFRKACRQAHGHQLPGAVYGSWGCLNVQQAAPGWA